MLEPSCLISDQSLLVEIRQVLIHARALVLGKTSDAKVKL